MYAKSDLSLNRRESKKLSVQFNKKIDYYIHKKFRNIVMYVNGKYFTQYEIGKKIDKAHLVQSLRFYGRIGDMHKIANKNQSEYKARVKKDKLEGFANVGREIAKDIVNIGMVNKVTVN